MSVPLNLSVFLKITFIAFSAQNFVFASKGEYGVPNETDLNPVAPAKALAAFDAFPPEIVEMIFEKLPKTDLKNARLINKKFNQIATGCVRRIELPDQTIMNEGNKGFQLFKNFVENLRSPLSITCDKKPADAVLDLFRNKRVESLRPGHSLDNASIQDLLSRFSNLQGLDLSSNGIEIEGMEALAPRLPQTLKKLNLSYNEIGAEAMKILALNLPKTLKELDLRFNINEMKACAPDFPQTLRVLR